MRSKTTKPLKLKPNPVRQAILIGLALLGIGIGYGMGFLLKKDPPPKSEQAIERPVAPSESKPLPSVVAVPESEPSAEKNEQLVAKTVLPESHSGEGKPRAYEEALPEEIVHFPAITVPPPVVRNRDPSTGLPLVPLDREQGPSELTKLMPLPSAEIKEPVESLKTEQAPQGSNQKPALEAVKKSPPVSTELADGWLKSALSISLSDKPKIAIVIDDMGVDPHRSRLASNLNGPLTLSYLTYARNLTDQTNAARKAGHELMLHIPMEPSSRDIDPGPNVLLSGVPAEETQAALIWGLDQFSGYVGVNNHMGSKFTSNLDGMKILMQELLKRKLFFLDSVTSIATKGQIAAKQFGVPFIARNIFLDHIDDIEQVKKRLNEVKRVALKKGYAVAIGHPRDATIKALGPWLETIESEGFQLVPVSALIRLAYQTETVSTPTTNKKEN